MTKHSLISWTVCIFIGAAAALFYLWLMLDAMTKASS